EETCRGRCAPDHLTECDRAVLAALRQEFRAAPQQHLQQLALRRRLAGQVAGGATGTTSGTPAAGTRSPRRCTSVGVRGVCAGLGTTGPSPRPTDLANSARRGGSAQALDADR